MDQYLAFISYRHSLRDQKISAQFRKKLETWHLPEDTSLPGKRRVFRDTDELPTSSDLGTDIQRALEGSGYLISLCSEEYMQSLWCLKEVQVFLELGRKDRILPVLVSGDPEKAIPEEIRDLPLAGDLRGLKGAALSSAIDACTAGILGTASGETPEKYLASEKRTRMLYGAGAFAAVLSAILGFSAYAVYTAGQIASNNVEIASAAEQAEKARSEALEERNRSLLTNARFLSEQAWDSIDKGDDINAIKLALSALPDDLHGDEPVSEAAVSALRAAVSMPARPKDTWKYSRSYDTGFPVTGYLSNYNVIGRGGVLLLDDTAGSSEHYMTLSDGEISLIESASRKKAAEAGYSMSWYCNSGSPSVTLLYGPELPLTSTWNYRTPEQNRFTLEDSFFYADHVLEAGSSYYFLAWLEDPLPGQASRTALFNMMKNKAVGALDIAGLPVSACFSSNRLRLAVVDESGTLSLFETETGKKKAVIPGKWAQVYYPKSSAYFCAVDDQGSLFLYNAVTLEQEAAYRAPSPIQKLQYCSEKGCFLTLSDDGSVRIIGEDLQLIDEFCPEAPPDDIFWSLYDDYLWSHTGNSFCLLYRDRVDLYEIETKPELDTTDYIPLFREGVVYRTAHAFYSADSRYVYLQQYQGEVSRWDAKTGDFLWENNTAWSIQGNVHDFCALSADGGSIWRVNSSMNGLERIDADSGKTLWSSSWDGVGHCLTPEENPDGSGSIAFAVGEYDRNILAFDPENGEELWRSGSIGTASWSPDGKEIRGVRIYNEEGTDRSYVQLTRLSPEDGHILEQKTLRTFEKSSGKRKIQVSEEQDRFAVINHPETEDGAGTHIEAFSLSDGRFLDSWDLSGNCSLVFSYTGRMAVRWTDLKEETEFCRTLEPGGGLGPQLLVESEEGRKLTTMREKDDNDELLGEVKASQYAVFGGEEAALNNIRLELDDLTLLRMSDGLPFLNFKYSGIAVGAAVAPDGNSLCIFGYYTTPRIILASDTETLVEKGKAKLARKGGE